MDQHNNRVGRQSASHVRSAEHCKWAAVNADMAGNLSIINDNGVSVSDHGSGKP
jgi:hypothetical protein